MRPSTFPSSNWVLYWGRPMSSSHPNKETEPTLTWQSSSWWQPCPHHQLGVILTLWTLHLTWLGTPTKSCWFSMYYSLTGNPMVIQFSMIVLLFRPKCLQSKLKLLPMQWVLYPKLLWKKGKSKAWYNTVFYLLVCYVRNKNCFRESHWIHLPSHQQVLYFYLLSTNTTSAHTQL